jgi:transposase
MMFGQGEPVKVFVATRPVDFCKGIDGMAPAVQEMFGLNPVCGAVFVFRSNRASRIKLLIRPGWCWCTSGWRTASSSGRGCKTG